MLTKRTNSRVFSILFVLVSMLARVGPAHAAPATLAAPPKAAESPSLLQYTAGGHVLGFAPGKVYLAGLDHALTVEFVNGLGKTPIGEAASVPAKAGSAPVLERVTYKDAWPGVDVSYTTSPTGLAESTYTLQPGARAANIRLKYNAPVQLLEDGSLSFAFENGTMMESTPIAWQQIGGKHILVDVHFRLNNNGQVGFALGMYNINFALTIDPTYVWHSFYGSSGDDRGRAIALDGSGNIYVTGYSDNSWNGEAGSMPLNPHTAGNNYDIVVVNYHRQRRWLWQCAWKARSYY